MAGRTLLRSTSGNERVRLKSLSSHLIGSASALEFLIGRPERGNLRTFEQILDRAGPDTAPGGYTGRNFKF
jgi:hypothetical protein